MFVVVRSVLVRLGFVRSVNDRLRAVFRLLGDQWGSFLCGLWVARVSKERVVNGRRGLLQRQLWLVAFNTYRFRRVQVLFV